MLLRSHRLDLAAARRELGDFEDFLRNNRFFGERAVVRLLKQSPNLTSGPIPTFASTDTGVPGKCWNQRTTGKYMILVEL
jgi:hypothetical protein